MPRIVRPINPFKPDEISTIEVPTGTTLREWVNAQYPSGEFPSPTVCLLNGGPLLRRDWGTPLVGRDEVVLVSQPGSVAGWVFYAVAIGLGIAAAMLIPKPKYESRTGDTVYTVKGQQNRVGLGEPVEEVFGRCRVWPKYAAIPYTRFINNEQYQYALFCIGQGEFADVQIQIEDTPIENFQNVTCQLYQPGQAVTLFDDNIVASTEVGGIELFGSNEEGYGYVGPFTTNEAGTLASSLEVDIVLPQGLCAFNSKGKKRDQQAAVRVEYQQINDAGDVLGDWQELTHTTWTMQTTTPQRFTFTKTVTPGRYRVRAMRANDKNKDNGAANTVQWYGLRAVLPSTRVYDGVTTLAVKMKATNQLNDSSAYRINGWVTRKLPIWDKVNQVWTANTATRSPIWAMLHVMRSKNGGQLGDAYFSLNDYADLAAFYEAEGRYFDYIFDTEGTTWEAAKLIARIGRALPLLYGSKVTWVRDTPKTLPSMLFGPHNIKANTFKVSYSFPRQGEYDGVTVEYTDPNDFLPRTVSCLIGDDGTAITAPRDGHSGDDKGDNLEEIKLLGCTSRNFAYREGCFYRAQKKFLRVGPSFETGMEGMLPPLGALVAIGHDLPRWAQHGHVLELNLDKRTVTLSDTVTFTSGQNHYIAFNLRDGTASEPILCTAGAAANQVVLSADAPDGLYLAENTALPTFLFGPGDNWSKKCIVTSATPSAGGSGVAIEASVYDARVYANDSAVAPDPEERDVPAPTVPVLNCASLAYNSATSLLSWESATNATAYEIETSRDSGATWANEGTTPNNSLAIGLSEGAWQIRVRPLGLGTGSWCSITPTLTEPPGTPDEGLPEVPGDYDDLLTQLGLIAEPVGSLLWSYASATPTLCGWDEYAGYVSSPPRKYHYKVLSGTVTDKTYNYGCSGTPNETCVTVYSGRVTPGGGYEPPRCDFLEQETGIKHLSCTGLEYDGECRKISEFYEDMRDVTYTATTKTVVFNGFCHDWGNGTNWMATGTGIETLTEEDTEAMAEARARDAASWAAWSTTAPISKYQARTTGFSWSEVLVKLKGPDTGFTATPGWAYKLTIATQQRAYGSSDAWADADPVVIPVVADSEGKISIPETKLDCPRGKERKAVSITWSYDA